MKNGGNSELSYKYLKHLCELWIL